MQIYIISLKRQSRHQKKATYAVFFRVDPNTQQNSHTPLAMCDKRSVTSVY